MLRSSTPPRFRASKPLAALERDLFRRYASSGDSQSRPVPEGVELVELPTRRLEAAYALSRIGEWVRDPQTGYRYRDVAIIVRDLEPYHELLTSALTQAGVPFLARFVPQISRPFTPGR